MRTIETDVFTFEELSDDAKKTAVTGFAYQYEFDSDCVLADFENICGIIGIELSKKPAKLMGGGVRSKSNIYFSGFSSQGDGASFEGRYRYKKGAVKSLKSYCNDADLFNIAQRLQNIQKKYFYSVSCGISKNGWHCHEYTMNIDAIVETKTREYYLSAADQDEMIECFRDLARWFYSTLEREYEYQNSYECISENLIANEYEFTEDGEML